jgi:hypothetical protein
MKIAILISLLFLTAIKLPRGETPETQTDMYNQFAPTDTSRYAILKLDSTYVAHLFGTGIKPTALSKEEIMKIKTLIDKKITEYNKLEKKGIYSLVINHPGKYYKQLVAIINAKGEKEVWVNCFCSVNSIHNWKSRLVRVMDGGSCYFQLKINLTTNTVYDFGVNGVA